MKPRVGPADPSSVYQPLKLVSGYTLDPPSGLRASAETRKPT
jgi:hypothetical protein